MAGSHASAVIEAADFILGHHVCDEGPRCAQVVALSHDPSFLRLDMERCELEAMGLICRTIQLSRVLKDNATRVLLNPRGLRRREPRDFDQCDLATRVKRADHIPQSRFGHAHDHARCRLPTRCSLECGVRFPPATTARFHYFSQEAFRGG